MSQNEPGVVDLVDAGVPADQGLSSLGLILQLAGNVLAALAALALFLQLVASSGMRSSDNSTLYMFLILGSSVTRSLFQKSAGVQLLYGSGGLERMAGVKRYITFALAQTACIAALMLLKFHAGVTATFALAAGLAAWPATLAVLLSLPRFKRFKDDLPLTEDKGFEGASILMTVLGLCGLAFGGTALVLMLELPGKALQQGPMVLIVLALGMLVVRSVFHVQAGFSGLRETSVDRSVELANRYANFGVISSFCAGGAMLMVAMATSFNVLFLAFVSGLCWMLMAWPMIIRKFYSDRQFADLLAGAQAPIHRRAPDAGLTSLGWLLLAHAVFSASFLLPQVVMTSGHGHGDRELASLLSLGGAMGLRSMWWSVGVVVLQAWAGYELVRMSPQSRVIATVYGVVGAAVTLYVSWPLVQAIKHMHGMMGEQDVLAFGPLAMSLIIPVATVLLVNRKIAPTARARFRSPQPPPAQP